MSAVGGDLICLGVVTGAQGIKGEVKLKSFTQEPLGIGDYGSLFDAAGARTFKITGLRMAKNSVIAKFAGVDDRDGAEALIHQELYVERSALPVIEDDEWYYADLVGLKAQTPEGGLIGTVEAVHNFGAGDLLEIKLQATNITEMVSFTDKTVPRIDVAGGYVVVIWPDEDEGQTDNDVVQN